MNLQRTVRVRGRECRAQLAGFSDSLGDRGGQRVVVEPAGKLPDAARPEDVLRLEPEDERLEIVEPVECCHRP